MSVWQKDKDVTDRFGVEVPTEFLDGEPLISVVIDTSEDETLVVSDETIVANLFTFLLSGGVIGFTKVLVRASTPTRQFEQTVTLWVKDN